MGLFGSSGLHSGGHENVASEPYQILYIVRRIKARHSSRIRESGSENLLKPH